MSMSASAASRAAAAMAVAVTLALAGAQSGRAGGAESLTARLQRHPGLVDAATVVPELEVELRYATADNFLGRSVYGDLRSCFLQRDAAEMLARAQAALVKAHPELRLRVYDCARPLAVQWDMWRIVKGTPQQPYVANPKNGSVHNYGCAVDLTVARKGGEALDMGTEYDFFGALARADGELKALDAGELTAEQVANRLILREAMLRGGFRPLLHEWWHFDCATQRDTRARYRIIP